MKAPSNSGGKLVLKCRHKPGFFFAIIASQLVVTPTTMGPGIPTELQMVKENTNHSIGQNTYVRVVFLNLWLSNQCSKHQFFHVQTGCHLPQQMQQNVVCESAMTTKAVHV